MASAPACMKRSESDAALYVASDATDAIDDAMRLDVHSALAGADVRPWSAAQPPQPAQPAQPAPSTPSAHATPPPVLALDAVGNPPLDTAQRDCESADGASAARASEPSASVYQRVKQHVHTVATNATVHSGLERDRRHGMWLCLVNLHLGKRIIAQRAVLYSIVLYANARVEHATLAASVAWNAIAFVSLIGMVRVRDALKPAEALAVALAASVWLLALGCATGSVGRLGVTHVITTAATAEAALDALLLFARLCGSLSEPRAVCKSDRSVQ